MMWRGLVIRDSLAIGSGGRGAVSNNRGGSALCAAFAHMVWHDMVSFLPIVKAQVPWIAGGDDTRRRAR